MASSSVTADGTAGATNAMSKNAMKKLQKEQEKAARAAANKAKAESANESGNVPSGGATAGQEEDFAVQNYGKLPLNQSQERLGQTRCLIKDISASSAGQDVFLRARVHTCRPTSASKCFFVFRQRSDTIQGLLAVKKPGDGTAMVSKQMIKWSNTIPAESIVLLQAKVVKAPAPVKSCTIQDSELSIEKLHIISEAEALPFSLEDASRSAAELASEDAQYSDVKLDTRLDNRVLDLRTITNQAIFQISSGVGELFRSFLQAHGFIEIHTPKLLGAASESGASVFKVGYFNAGAFLAQSPQLHKQMCIAADFERVYEIGPVFRAENSNTHRHMTEFIGVDMEMAFEEHYHEALDMIDEMFLSVFKGLESRYSHLIKIIQRQFPLDDFVYLDKTLRLTYSQGIAILREDGVELGDYDDLSTEQEKRLGRLVKARYKTDYFILDKFPLAIRPFYTMASPEPGWSNSYDFFMRGEEILSGAQRIHDPVLLEAKLKEFGIDPATLAPYLNAFKLGCPPHAGGGIGLERVVMLYLGLGNIRRASFFPRDPKRLEP